MDKFSKFVRLVKIEDEGHKVYGIATSEVPDKDNEIADYEASKKAFQLWSEDFVAKTSASGQDLSLGNVRLMHGLTIAGKVTKLICKDMEKQIWIESTPCDDTIWNLIKGGFITGYSMGGSYAWKRKEGEFQRIAPTIAEVSYVDNPCNPEASFAYVKTDGSVEMRKFADPTTLPQEAKTLLAKAKEDAGTSAASQDDQDHQKLIAKLFFTQFGLTPHSCDVCEKEAKTKKKGGKNLSSSDFAYVGDPDDTSTWKLPIHDAAHVRNALARFNQTEGIPSGEKAKVHARIVAAAKKFGIEVSDGKNSKTKKIFETLSETCAKVVSNTTVEKAEGLEAKCLKAVEEYRQNSFYKGMYEVSRLAVMVDDLYYLILSTAYERDAEGDESPIPDELHNHLKGLAEVLVSMVEEETKELLAQHGGLTMALTPEELKKAAKTLHDHLEKLKEMHTEHCEKMCKLHKDMEMAAHSHLDKCMKAIGSMEEKENETEDQKKAREADELKKAEEAKKAEELKKATEAEAAKKAEELKKAAEGNPILTTLVETVQELAKAQKEGQKLVTEQATKIEELLKSQASELARTTAKQTTTLINRDGSVLSKVTPTIASGSMANTGL
jgi:hypothetical protein